MAGKQAKILSQSNLNQLLAFTRSTRCPQRNAVIVLLSVKAGLRAGEIAHLTWDMVLDAQGNVSNTIELRDWAAKNKSGRRIPIHPHLHQALADWKLESEGHGPVVRSERGSAMTPVSIRTASTTSAASN